MIKNDQEVPKKKNKKLKNWEKRAQARCTAELHLNKTLLKNKKFRKKKTKEAARPYYIFAA